MKKIMFVGDAESIHIAKYVNYYANKSDYDVCIATFSQTNCTDCKNVTFIQSAEELRESAGLTLL